MSCFCISDFIFSRQFFYKAVASGAQINSYTYSVLLKNLLAVGNWRKYIEVTTVHFFVESAIFSLYIIDKLLSEKEIEPLGRSLFY